MLRASILRARPVLRPIGPIVRPQWRLAQRFYADDKTPPAPSTTPSKSSSVESSAIPHSSVPKPPPAPASTASRSAPVEQPATTPPTGTGSASIAPDTKPPKKKKKGGAVRRLFYLLLLSSLGYAGGVWYSLVSDNFHDFFTEYIPFAEDAVGYFEEREFRKRFPGRAGQPRLHPQLTGENKITIPSKSGLGPKISDEGSTDLAARGPHVSALSNSEQRPTQKTKEASKPDSNVPPAKAVQEKKQEEGHKEKPTESASHALLPKEPKQTPAPTPSTPATPSKPIAHIDNLNDVDAHNPIIQSVVKIVNDIITAINADASHGNKYDSALEKAKSDIDRVIADINDFKFETAMLSDKHIEKVHAQFDEATMELVRRLEVEMQEQETRWKEEFENERERLSQIYKEKTDAEVKAASEFFSQQLDNQLLEQSLHLHKSFSETVREQVESEREGRLGRLDELSSSVQELEKLTAEWNSVVDANLKTQHLVVAVEAVKSALENQTVPRPFVTELSALKEIANNDPIVSAAIASINPAAYQRGIPNAGQLVDRFRRVAQEVRKASLLPEDAGIASHLASLAMSKVLFKKSGLAVGQDVEATLARTEVLLEEGDLDAAAREMNGLQGWAKVLSKDWLADCRRVLEVRQALDVIAAEARLQSLLVK